MPGEEFDRFIEKASTINRTESLIEDIDFIGSSVLGIQDKIEEAKSLLDGDQALGNVISESGKVVLPTFMFLGEAYCKPDFETPDYVKQFSLTSTFKKDQQTPLTAYGLQFPTETVSAGSSGMGHLNAVLDIDGSARTEALVVDYFGEYYPSMSLMLAAKTLNLDLSEVLVTGAPSVKIGKLNIKTDSELKMHAFYYANIDGRSALRSKFFF